MCIVISKFDFICVLYTKVLLLSSHFRPAVWKCYRWGGGNVRGTEWRRGRCPGDRPDTSRHCWCAGL